MHHVINILSILFVFTTFAANTNTDLHKQICKLNNFVSLFKQKLVPILFRGAVKGTPIIFPELFPKLFTADHQADKSNYLIGTTMHGKQIALPLTYSELESAIAVEAEYGEEGARGKFLLIVAPGQSGDSLDLSGIERSMSRKS